MCAVCWISNSILKLQNVLTWVRDRWELSLGQKARTVHTAFWRRFRAAHSAPHRMRAAHAQICSKTLSAFVWQFPHLFERCSGWLVVMWSAANVMVRPNSIQAKLPKTLKSGLRTIRPIIVKLQTACLHVDSLLMEKEEMMDVELLVEHIRKQPAVVARIWPTGPITAQKSIVPACSMRLKIRSLDSFWAKLKKDPNSSVCFDIPGSRKNRRREAAELVLIWIRMRRCCAPMRRRLIRMQMQMLTLRTRMQMTLRLRQGNRCHRRLPVARCHQEPGRNFKFLYQFVAAPLLKESNACCL